jgi:putative transposase
MRKTRYSEEQIIKILREAEKGRKVPDLRRDHGIAQDTFYRWRRKYGGMELTDAKRLRQLEEENRRLKKVVADLTLDKEALKDALSRKW